KRFDPALLETLAQDTGQEAAYLPLLQLTLQELWSKGSLKRSQYSDLTDAIQRRAELVFQDEDYSASLPEKERPPGDQTAILEIFLDLVDVSLDDDPRRDVRRRRAKLDLVGASAQRQNLVNDLIEARLLSSGEETQERLSQERSTSSTSP
ncbi:MAG TPA: hypothetical protein VI776_03390, partial [Anaerolineales bacterium]|nr:hypothetical protein [Anaerolineales bacterium]